MFIMWSAGVNKNEVIQIAKEHNSHKARLQEMKPRIDTKAPKEQTHVKQKVKSKAQKNMYISLVHAENQLLLQKMISINTRTPAFKRLIDTPSSKSLNDNLRVQNLTKITEENQLFLNRLQGVKSNYNLKKWTKDFKFNKYLSSKLSENSRRIPRMSSLGITPSFESTRTPVSRPETALLNIPRPFSSNFARPRLNNIDL